MVSPADPITVRLEELKALLGPLPSAGLPLALLPVGLETRFVSNSGRGELLVRIRPDNLWADAHEPGLDEGEITWGRQYWDTIWRSGKDADIHQAAWDRLSGRFGRSRAGWIVRSLTPQNLGDRPPASLPEGVEPPVQPAFPAPPTRGETWEAPAVLKALPDRWIILGYQGSRRVFVQWSNPVLGPLAVSPEPGRPDDEPLPEGAGEEQLALDPGLRWLVNFEEAERVGMAVRVPLPPVFSAAPVFNLLCLGLTGSGNNARLLEDLLAAQRYTDGLAFVPAGTPTNNSSQEDSGYDSDGGLTAPIPNGKALPAGSNGAVAARALGIKPALFAGVPHASSQEERSARSLNTLLWPATGGYFLEGLLRGPGLPERFPDAGQHFIENVRAGGPLPLLRVGRQPYGLLPVMSLDRLAAASPGEGQFLTALRSLRLLWRQALPKVPQALPGEDPNQAEADLLEILRMESSSVSYSARLIFDRAIFGNPGVQFSQTNLTQGVIARRRFIEGKLQAAGLNWQPRLLDVVPGNQIVRLNAPLVQSGPPEESLKPNYLDWLRRATFTDILAENFTSLPGAPERINNLFYLVARHAVLLAYALAAQRILVSEGLLPDGTLPEPALVDILGGVKPERTTTLLRLLDMVVPSLGGQPLNQTIHTLGKAQHPQAAGLDDLRNALKVLAALPVGELDRLLRGGLDLFSYRLDGWITSLATRRLAELRDARQAGVALGAYGWVEGLRPSPRSPLPQAPEGEAGSPLFSAASSGGFLHAPSLAQASAAAILRSGFLSEVGEEEDQRPLAVNLSSGRVRLSEWLLNGIRQGQSMAALLGYRFERGLHERRLDRYIAPLRRLAPLSALDKARVRLEAAEAEVERLRKIPHPDLAAALARLEQKRRIVSQLITERDQLPSRQEAARRSITTLDGQIRNTQAEIKRLQNILQHSGENPQVEARLDAQLDKLANQQAARQDAADHLSDLQRRSGEIGEDINNANQDVQAAEAEVRALSGLENPDLPAAREVLAAAQQEFDRLLSEFRQRFLFPSGAGVAAMESVAAHSVVDGLALLELWQSGDFPFEKVRSDLPAQDRAGLEAELRALEAAVDAVGDALTAESVYQWVQGNPARAGATLDAVVQGDLSPPELEVAQTLRSGVGVTHRLLVLFGDPDSAEVAAWPANERQVRATAEPRLNAWAARLLGNPEKVRASVEFLDPARGEVLSRGVARLKALGLAPLDVVYLAAGNPVPEGSQLERLLLYHQQRNLPASLPPGATVRLRFEPQADWAEDELSFAELLELAGALGKLILGSRPVSEGDFTLPGRDHLPGLDLAELKGRADRAVKSLADAHRLLSDQLDLRVEEAEAQAIKARLERIRGLLLRLFQLGLPDAVPLSAPASDTEPAGRLLEQAAGVAKAAARRLEGLRDLEGAFASDQAGVEATRDHHLKRLEVVFGGGFRSLPVLQPANAAELEAAFNSSEALQDGQPHQVSAWFRRAARVRQGAGRLGAALTYAAALGRAGALDFTVGQLPLQQDDRWAALPAPPERPFPAGKISLVAHLPQGFTPGRPLAGLLVDEWAEVVPNPNSLTGVAFHFDAPGARPPQAILLAVKPAASPPAGDDERWDLETLESTLLETQELARLRAVDPEALAGVQELPHFLPALYFSLNLAGETLSTDFRRAA